MVAVVINGLPFASYDFFFAWFLSLGKEMEGFSKKDELRAKWLRGPSCVRGCLRIRSFEVDRAPST